MNTQRLKLLSKLCVTTRIVFDTAWRIGSGREGETMSDQGVLLDRDGLPVLPGSTLKGCLRSRCESLAEALGMTACFLDNSASGQSCVSDVNYYTSVRPDYVAATQQGLAERLKWIDDHTCDVCKLFGSPVEAARLHISDGRWDSERGTSVEIRDGVVIDRDSHTAVDGLKYDYEVVPAGASFKFQIDLTNPNIERDRPMEEALLAAALFEWSAGFSLGGFTSRGLGRAHVEEIVVRGVNFDDLDERRRYLTGTTHDDRLTNRGNWEDYFQARIEESLQPAN